MSDKAFGPLSRDQLFALAAKPGFGNAADGIRKIDPSWGRDESEMREFTVVLEGGCAIKGEVVVLAHSADDARKRAWREIDHADFDVIDGTEEFHEIIAVEDSVE